MSNQIGVNGGQPQKQTRFAPIYTGRWSSGLYTNRSPLRDANTTRLQEKYYGPSGDALIGGINTEITNRLTLGRRPGNPVFGVNDYTAVDNFQSFRLFDTSNEQIDVMIDQANALYAEIMGVKTLVWTKSTGAGETFMQSVGNSLYFGNGVDNKKWLQSLFIWTALTELNTVGTPILRTFFVDGNGNIQQLTGTALTIEQIEVDTNVLSVYAAGAVDDQVAVGDETTFSGVVTNTFLNGETVTITAVFSDHYDAAFTHADVALAADSGLATVDAGGNPVTGASEPTWSTTVPSSGNNFQGGVTLDGSAVWTNRGLPVENWGLKAPTGPPDVTVGSSRSAWQKNTFFSIPGVIIDSNGNVQQVTTAGLAGGTEPVWATLVGNTTTDGTVVWTMIQDAASLIWAANTHYDAGTFLVNNASGVDCLFELQPVGTSGGGVTLDATVNISLWAVPPGSQGGQFIKTFPAPTPDATTTSNSLMFNSEDVTAQPMQKATLNGAGEITAETNLPAPSTSHYNMAVYGSMAIPVAGQYTIKVVHQNGFFFGMNGANPPTLISGINSIPTGQTQTAVNGYSNVLAGNNNRGGDDPVTDSFVINFPEAASYNFEFDFSQNDGNQKLVVKANNNVIPPQPSVSGATEPIWPAWTTVFAPNYPNVKEASGQYQWNNMGPIADFVWQANINFTLPGTTIIDTNGNTEAPYRTGVTGTDQPTWSQGLNQLTLDNPNLTWINQGPASAPPPGTVSTFNGGWKYGIALVNTLDDTVSNLSQLSPSTGNFVGAEGVTLAPASGLPADLSQIDPQADFVAIFRTTDGGSTPFLIGGTGNSIYTLPLSEYIANGYTDTSTDEELNNLISAAINGENTPPLPGAVNLTFYLERIFFSIGNTVYWTSGPDTPVGNGVNGVAPDNFDVFPSLVKRIVPTAIGALVFTVSDIFIIQGNGTDQSPIQSGQNYEPGVGLLSYNALAINGSLIGFFTTDKQFLIIDPSAGVSYAGFPIGDKFRKDDGQPGTNWNPADVYVTWHVDGEDQAWYVSDGEFGWYRLMATPTPETGYTWSPFARIVQGAKAVQSVEVSPGVHKLLLGPTGTGSILKRDLDTFSDDGVAYPAYSIVGSAVLAEPGQVAEVSFFTTDAVNVGTPLTIGVLMDEAYPYFTGPFEKLKLWVTDPTNLTKSKSILGQRFYFSELKQAAICRHMQVRIDWVTEAAPNELLSATLFGAFMQEI